MKIKPKLYSMSSTGYTLIYKCGKCSKPLTMASDSWKFCPCCGSEIDWGVIETANEEFKELFLETFGTKKQNELLKYIDEANLAITDGSRHEMIKTTKTKNAIIKSNIEYYLNIGWTEEQLIKEKRFKEEDFE